ncbi:MAG: nucleotide exchange factor GrpE [Anaerolineaceae bacterium]|nr:nucleotide exchange factor GrpE [Anaerolineaceae bacterium]
MPESKRHHKQDDPMGRKYDRPEIPQSGDGPVGAGAESGNIESELIPAEDLDSIKKELEECRTQSTSYFDGWQRERADFSNYRRRIEREQVQAYQNAVGNVTKKFLVVSDDLSRALKNCPTGGEAAAWAEGLDLIYRKLQQLLESEGVQKMDATGEQFDPNRHEAISHEDSPDHESGQIIEVVQDGYLLGDRVLRPALVRVAR